MFITKDICPVPFDQQPLNEYIALKKSCFFSWSILSIDKYIRRICNIFFSLFIVLYACIYSTIISNKNILRICCYDVFIITFIFIVIFTRLYLGWSYIVKRLVSSTVFYEESGWYDGQIWIKNIESITKDRLIGLYEVVPFINRIKYSLFSSILCFMIELFMIYLL
uniref:Conserved hypothetical plastid protein n=1 Tax=Mastocarpus papillatus TaxID=31436 RepID=A0A342RZJ6_9FLOR|nr:conserved hypothetical plastid protein [Mastocarpus papillatus]AOL58142.1 conserved hypothetical plastid protein [Mastocarpus papillatus]